MQFDDQQVDAGQLDDRRGMSSGAKLGAGAGGIGVVGLLVGAGREPARGQRWRHGGRRWTRCSAAAPASAVRAVARRATSSARCNVAGGIDTVRGLLRPEDLQRGERGLGGGAAAVRRDVHEPAAGVLPAGGADRRLRHGEQPDRAVLLPAGPAGVLSTWASSTSCSSEFGATGELCAGVHRRARGRAPPAEPARHRAARCGSSSRRTRGRRTRCRCGWSCRPTATPASGAAAGQPARATCGSRRRSRPGDDRGGCRRRRPDPGAAPAGGSTPSR